MNGKRHDKSFGRGDLAQAKAQVFDRTVQDALEKHLPIPDPEWVTSAVQVVKTVSTSDAPTNQVLGQQPSGMNLAELGRRYLDHMFYDYAKKAGLKPIIGCEVYVAPEDRRNKDARSPRDAGYHLVLLAQNMEY